MSLLDGQSIDWDDWEVCLIWDCEEDVHRTKDGHRYHRRHRHHDHDDATLTLAPRTPKENTLSFTMRDNQNVDIDLAATNPDGTPGTIDAGSLTASMASGTEAVASVTTDPTTGASIVNVRAEGVVTADDLLTVSCTIGGQPATATLDFSLTGVAVLGLTPRTPVDNA